MNKVSRDRSLRNKIKNDSGLSMLAAIYNIKPTITNHITKVNNRCSLSGRSRAVSRKFGLNRVMIREMYIELGRSKSSW